MMPRGALTAWYLAASRALPRDAATWTATIALAIGMAVLASAAAAQRGIMQAAVAPEHQRLHIVGRPPIDGDASTREPGPMSLADYAAWRDNPALRPIALAERTAAILSLDGTVQRRTVWRVSAEIPVLLGISDPLAGRLPRPSSNGAPIELALSANAADEWFTSPQAALNQPVRIDGAPAIIVGVLREPPGDAFAGIEAWTVFDPDALLSEQSAADPEDPLLTTPYFIGITAGTIAARTGPSTDDAADEPVIAPLPAVVLGPRIPAALSAASSAGTLLFAASLAASAMLLAGAMLARREELALRLALGSTRTALLLELIASAVTICLIAGGLALLGSWWIVDAARGALQGTLPGTPGITLLAIDRPAATLVLLIAICTLGLTSAIVAWPVQPAWCVRGLPGVKRASWNRLDDAAVVLHAGLAASALLLALFTGSLAARAAEVPPGLSVRGVGSMPITLPWWRIEDDNERWRIIHDTLLAAEQTRLFESVAAADNAPIVGPDFRAIVVAASPETTRIGEPPTTTIARLRSATPGTTSMLGINEVRRLTEQAASTLLRLYESEFPPLPATISRSLAIALFAGEDNALGQPIELGEQRIPALVLAIVDDAADGPDTFDTGGPSIWLPMPIGWESPTWTLLLKLSPDATEQRRAEAEAILRSAIQTIIDDAAIDPTIWLDQRVAERARIYTVSATIASGAALVAITLALLACIARTRLAIAGRLDELRLRSAFGQPAALLILAASFPGFASAAIGVALALTLTPWLAGRITLASDLETPAIAGILPVAAFLLACAIACLVTARTARVDAEALFRSL